MKMLSEKWWLKYVERELRIEEVKIEIKKEFVHLQGHESKVLVIRRITTESETMDANLMEMKLWNGTHAKFISFKRQIVK